MKENWLYRPLALMDYVSSSSSSLSKMSLSIFWTATLATVDFVVSAVEVGEDVVVVVVVAVVAVAWRNVLTISFWPAMVTSTRRRRLLLLIMIPMMMMMQSSPAWHIIWTFRQRLIYLTVSVANRTIWQNVQSTAAPYRPAHDEISTLPYPRR